MVVIDRPTSRMQRLVKGGLVLACAHLQIIVAATCLISGVGDAARLQPPPLSQRGSRSAPTLCTASALAITYKKLGHARLLRHACALTLNVRHLALQAFSAVSRPPVIYAAPMIASTTSATDYDYHQHLLVTYSIVEMNLVPKPVNVPLLCQSPLTATLAQLL